MGFKVKHVFSLMSFTAGVFWQVNRVPVPKSTTPVTESAIKYVNVTSSPPILQLKSTQAKTAEPKTAQPKTLQPETLQSKTVQLKTVQPETIQSIDQLCFQLTVCANCSGFAFGDAIICRHRDHFDSLKATKVGNLSFYNIVYISFLRFYWAKMRFLEGHVSMKFNQETVLMLESLVQMGFILKTFWLMTGQY